MNKIILNLVSRAAILGALLVTPPLAVAQIVSPVAPVWKWGQEGPAFLIPNMTHIYDTYDQALHAYIAGLNLYPVTYIKWAPRVNFFYPPDSPWREHCHNCSLYTQQSTFDKARVVVEKYHEPHPTATQNYEYIVSHVGRLNYIPICPTGYARLANNNLPYPERFRCERQQSNNTPIPEKSPKSCPEEGLIGNPINLGLKAKFHSETDYQTGSSSGLRFERQYSSASLSRRKPVIGENWWHNYDRNITFTYNSSTQTVYADRHDGRAFLFTLQNGVWKTDSDINDRLVRLVEGQGNPSGWLYFNASRNETEEYDVAGRLVKITAPNGQYQTLVYSDTNTPSAIAPVSGLLIQVLDHFGRALGFEYNETRMIDKMIDPVGGIYTFSYSQYGKLLSVFHPDNSSKTYHYEVNSPSSCVNALTGITDERGIRFATYAYDSECRVISSEHAGGVGRYSVIYGSNTATVVDPLSTSRTYNFTTKLGVSKNTSVSQPCATCGGNAAQARTYDANGNVSQKTDFNGNITQYQYNSRNLETSRTEAYGTSNARTITTAWHSTLTLPTQIVEPGRTTAFTYDSNGNKLTETITDTTVTPNFSRTTTWTYNTNGQVLTIDGPRTDVADITEFEYDSEGNISLITDALGHETEMPDYDAHGNPLTIIDPNGIQTELVYDARQRLISRTIAAGTTAAATTLFDYDPVGNIEKITRPAGSSSGVGSTLEYIYDDAQRLIKIKDTLGNYISYTLDNAGNRTEEKIYDPTDVLVKTQSSIFNGLSRLIGSVGASSQSTEYAYDNNGNQTGITDPNNNATINTFDALNRLIKTVDPENGATNPTEYAYDARDNLAQVEDPRGLVTQYQYNGFNEVTQQTSPDTGVTLFTYDSAGNRSSKTDAKSVTINYSYDALNRVTLVDAPGVNDDISYSYDSCTLGVGRLCSVMRDDITVNYVYDAHGNMQNVEQDIGSISVDMSYNYDANNRLENITYPSGVSILYTYDTAGRVEEISLNDGTTTSSLIDTISYQPMGPVKSYDPANGVNLAIIYDLDGRIETIQAGSIVSRDYGYDPASNINLIDESILTALSRSYTYDAINRLSLEEDITGTNTLFDYAYDPVGNRSLYDNTITSETLTYGTTSNRLTTIGSQSVISDNNGNITSIHGMTLDYDVYNRLNSATVGSTTTNYAYNGLGERTTKTTGSNTSHYFYGAQQQLLAEYDTSGAVEREYIYLNGQPVVMLVHDVSTINKYWIHNDHLGRPLALTDSVGDAVWQLLDADAFGNATNIDEDPDNDSTNLAFNLRFPGQYFDEETGLHYNYFRDYDPRTGRYIGSDPIGLRGGLNTYNYVYSNPVAYIDLLGLEVVCRYLAQEYLATWSTIGEEWQLLWTNSFKFLGPGEPNITDCNFLPPGRRKFPCQRPLKIWRYTQNFWEIKTYQYDWEKTLDVYRCTDDCTGESEIVKQNEQTRVQNRHLQDTTWFLEFLAKSI